MISALGCNPGTEETVIKDLREGPLEHGFKGEAGQSGGTTAEVRQALPVWYSKAEEQMVSMGMGKGR